MSARLSSRPTQMSKLPPEFAADPQTRVLERRSGWRVVNLSELTAYRDLLAFLVVRDVKVLYKQTVLGFGWAILRPFFSMVVFTVVFGRLAKVPSDGLPYPLFSFAALVPWTYFQTAVTNSTGSLVASAQMISKVYFPRIMIPLAPVLAGLVDFTISLAFLGLMMSFYGLAPSPSVVALPLLVVIMVATAAGVGLWLSVLAIQYRDVKFAMQFAVQILMYAAPVVWPASLVPQHLRVVYGLYPMAGVIEGMRAALLGHNPFPWDLVGIGAMVAASILVSGVVYFRYSERVLADVA
jgi:lipopolysaccharide transport system permease protein